MEKVIVGMSGGVDSAVAAYLLKEAGYDVTGVTLRTWVSDDGGESRCCEIDDARETAKGIGIAYHVFNCVSEFEETIVRSFVEDYLHGKTPNPCVLCNREIKWERLVYYANVLGADYVATGHYASVVRLDNGRYTLQKSRHARKDQTYMLYRLTQEQLARTLTPLENFSKEEVRSIAKQAGIRVASKPDSQEICFVTDGAYGDFVAAHAGGEAPGEGNFVDGSGKVLGRHKGIFRYTVGQRRGLGISSAHPLFVKKICPETNEVILGSAEEILCRELECENMNFLSIPEPSEGEALRCRVTVRYSHAGEAAVVEKTGADRFRIVFDNPVRFAAPGQSAVFYDEEDMLIGGGAIRHLLS